MFTTPSTMSLLTPRQSPLEDDGAQYYGYDGSNCYEEHTCGWWWSPVSPISQPKAKTTLHIPSPNKPLTTNPDRLRRPLHHSLDPLLPALRLLRRRLLARAPSPTQKSTTPSLPPMDGADQLSALPLQQRLQLQLPSRRANVPPKCILRPATAPGQLRYAEQHFRASTSCVSGR